jgi:murein DD-endopeptidase MepM/ murein hydrolase activator NlpD
MIPRPLTAALLAPLAALAVLLPAGGALADVTATVPTTEAAASTPETTTVPAPPAAEPTPSTTTTTTGTSSTTTPTEATTVPAPEVRMQRPQPPTVVPHVHGSPHQEKGLPPATPRAGTNSNATAVSPSALTPPLPSTLGGSLSGVPSFFIDSFSIPPFLLPIYQAAGAAYGIPWQVLAAINEVETDYGRDLSVSTAGAEGWMQFLPSTWGQYGVDVNNDGFEDPYNPADAIFAAARYLKAAGGNTDIRAAVFSYNHSESYVNSVLLRARLLGGTPPALLGAITGLTEARFPVYAASHYSDGFPITEGSSPHTVAGTTIYSQDGAPVIAVQDGRIVGIGEGGPLGRRVLLRDAYGNTYTYAGLGTLATLYPVLEALNPVSTRPPIHQPTHPGGRTVGLSGAADASGIPSPAAYGATRQFRAGPENVYLHPLRVGAHVIAGTVLGHVGAAGQPHMVFQIRPAGAPPVDPKPILDGWVKLQSSSAIKAKGRDPFAKISPTPGQALLESKTQLEQQVPRDRGIHLAPCEQRLIADGRTDRRVLAALAFLSASGLKPTVSGRSCTPASAAAAAKRTVVSGEGGAAADISAVNGLAVAGPTGPSSIATVLVHKLGELQGVMRPLQIASSTRFAGAANSVALPGYRGVIHIAFTPLGGPSARAAGGFGSGLTPAQWLKLVARLGEVPDPTVSPKPSPAAIPAPSSKASSAVVGGR